MRRTFIALAIVLVVLLWSPAWAQSSKPYGRVSFYATTDTRSPDGAPSASTAEFATSFTFRTTDQDASGLDAGVDMRHTRYSLAGRPDRVSLYDGFVGARLGKQGQLRVRVGHQWLPDLGTAGALAGGLIEYRTGASGTNTRLRVGAFGGAEPLGYEAGYASGVRKYGGYVALENGFLRRHVVGFAHTQNGAVSERSVLSVTNYLPVGKAFFAYQALEYDLQGPANGAAKGGLSYFLVNARASAGPRVELQGTYNRGRSINARQLSADMMTGRPLSARAIDGLRYETAGGRVSVRVARGVELYGGYARDRNNEDDRPTGRTTFGGYASNLFKSGFDVSGSDARIDRPTGPYHAFYLSIGRSVGRSLYVSGDYSTSLAVVRFQQSDGVTLETRPWTRRLSGNVSATLSRQFSLIGVVDWTMDEGMRDLRVMSGLTFRMR